MRLKLQHLAIGLLAMLPMLSWAQSENEEQKEIQITFAASGDTETVESILVENLTQEGEQIELDGTDILVLSAEGTGIENASTSFGSSEPLLYPNPAEGDGNLVFDVKQDGNVTVSIFSMNGVLMERAVVPVFEGRNALTIPSQGYGFHMVYVEGNGIHFSQKWMCGAPNSGNGIRHNGTNAIELPKEEIMQTRAQAPVRKGLKFKAGDLLRFTATSGNMKTIVLQKPQIEHTITFQMYKCQDADGYNYPIIEVGGMLWMAEDLHLVQNSGLEIAKDAADWTKSDANPLRMAYSEFNAANANTGAYYTPRAATKALPEGWKLPTADELLVVNESFGGAEKAGALLKSHGEDAIWNTLDFTLDEVQLNIEGNGCLNASGEFVGLGNIAYIVTRSYTGGKPHCMKLADGSDKAAISLETFANNNEGYTIRGVRAAQSPYNGYISQWLSTNPENAPKRFAGKDLYGIEGNPFAYTAPLGYRSLLPSGIEQVVVMNERRDNKTKFPKSFYSKYNESNRLHRYVGQGLPNGLQRTIKLSWSNLSNDPNFSEDFLEDKSLWGEGTITMEVVGDSTEDRYLDSYTVDAKFNLPKLNVPFPEQKISEDEYFKDYWYYEYLEYYMSSLKAICADFNEDGIEDILTGIGSKIVIIDGKDYQTILFEKEFDVANSFDKSISCTAGDINRDGRTDLAVIYEKGNNYYMEVWWEGLESFGGYANEEILLGKGSDNPNYPEYHGIIFADIDQDGNTDVISQLYNDDKMDILMMSYNYNNKNLDGNYRKSFECDRNGDSRHLGNREMAVMYAEGISRPPFLLANDYMLKWNRGTNDMEIVDCLKNVVSGCYAIGRFTDINIDKESLKQVVFKRVYGDNEYNVQATVSEYEYDNITEKFVENINDSKPWKYENYTLAKGHLSSNNDFMKSGAYVFMPLTKVRHKHPIREIELSSIETSMSEPRIYALLAAPPFWAEYRDQYTSEASTSWGKSKGSGDGASSSSSNSANMILGFEQDFNIPVIGTKVGGIDLETQIKNTWEQSHESSTMTEYGIEYSAIFEDVVVLTLTPYTTYDYIITKSANPDDLGNHMLIGAPDRPRTMPLSLDNYMILRADNKSIPDLRALIKHQKGSPFSYKKRYIDDLPSYGNILWGDGEWDKWVDSGTHTATTRSISVTQEQVSAKETEFSLDVTLVITAFGVKAGGGYGYTNKNGISHTETVGHTISGTIIGTQSLTEDVAKNFSWNICRVNVRYQGQAFPIVTYVVRQ